MTEEKARTKWCPFMDVSPKATGEWVNRSRCIASDCMAWRWDVHPDPERRRHSSEIPSGFCGLARDTGLP